MKRLLLALLLLLPAPMAAASESPASYYVPPAQFSAALQIMDLGFANIFALFPNATGSFSFDEGAKSLSRLRLALDAGSLMTGNGESQRDLANLLGIMQYSEIRIVAPDSVAFANVRVPALVIVSPLAAVLLPVKVHCAPASTVTVYGPGRGAANCHLPVSSVRPSAAT